jgi:hypothetical protein
MTRLRLDIMAYDLPVVDREVLLVGNGCEFPLAGAISTLKMLKLIGVVFACWVDGIQRNCRITNLTPHMVAGYVVVAIEFL